jgi:hypothetical protein
LSDFIHFTTGLRLKENCVLKRQVFAAFFDQADFNEDKSDLEEAIGLLKASIAYLDKIDPKSDRLATKKRELVKLETDYHHMLEMAPGKIFTANDVALLQQKYIPIAQDIFAAALKWTKGEEKLGFDMAPTSKSASTPVPAQAPVFTPQMNAAMDYLHQHANGFFPALALLKKQQSNLAPNQLRAFVAQCQKEKLISPADYEKIQAIKAKKAASAA